MPHFWNVAALLAFFSAGFLYALSATKIQLIIEEQQRFLTMLLAYLNQFLAGFLYLVLGFSYWIARILAPKNQLKPS